MGMWIFRAVMLVSLAVGVQELRTMPVPASWNRALAYMIEHTPAYCKG